jgi:hypothetical protein
MLAVVVLLVVLLPAWSVPRFGYVMTLVRCFGRRVEMAQCFFSDQLQQSRRRNGASPKIEIGL